MPIHISPSRPRHHVGLRGSPTATIPSRAPADLPPVIKIYLNGQIEEVQKSFPAIMSPEIPHNQCHYFIAGSRTSLWRPRGSLMVVRVSRRCAQGGLIGPRKPSCKLRPRSLHGPLHYAPQRIQGAGEDEHPRLPNRLRNSKRLVLVVVIAQL